MDFPPEMTGAILYVRRKKTSMADLMHRNYVASYTLLDQRWTTTVIRALDAQAGLPRPLPSATVDEGESVLQERIRSHIEKSIAEETGTSAMDNSAKSVVADTKQGG